MRSELFGRDVYSCQGEAERRSTQQTLQAVLAEEEKEDARTRNEPEGAMEKS